MSILIALPHSHPGRVNSVARKFAWAPLEIVKNFGVRNTPNWIKEAARSGAERLIVVWNLIEPTAVGQLKEYDPVLRQQPNLDATRNCEIILRQELETLFYIDAFTAMDLFRDNIDKVTATQINYAKMDTRSRRKSLGSGGECRK